MERLQCVLLCQSGQREVYVGTASRLQTFSIPEMNPSAPYKENILRKITLLSLTWYFPNVTAPQMSLLTIWKSTKKKVNVSKFRNSPKVVHSFPNRRNIIQRFPRRGRSIPLDGRLGRVVSGCPVGEMCRCTLLSWRIVCRRQL